LERQLAQISFHIAVRAVQLLEYGKVPAVEPNVMVIIQTPHQKSTKLVKKDVH